MSAVANEVQVKTPAAAGEWYGNYLWLIKREFWEHRGGLILTPLITAAVILAAILWGVTQMNPGNMKITVDQMKLDGPGVRAITDLGGGAHFIASIAFSVPFLIVMFFVTSYYTMDALFADRKDRSVLFWKSLPVSDFETVISKLLVASFVAPLIVAAIALVTQYVGYLFVSIGLSVNGQSFGALWAKLPFFQNMVLAAYTALLIGIWYLPIWSWFLMVSAFAQRAVFLWATVPIAAVCFLEYQILGTKHSLAFIDVRFNGFEIAWHNIEAQFGKNFDPGKLGAMGLGDFLTPGAYFSSPQLWIGLVMTAAFVAAAVWMRRYRDST